MQKDLKPLETEPWLVKHPSHCSGAVVLVTGSHFPLGGALCQDRVRVGTYVDHSIGCDAEEGGPLVHSLQLLTALVRDPEPIQLIQGALERGAVLGDEVVARAEVI